MNVLRWRFRQTRMTVPVTNSLTPSAIGVERRKISRVSFYVRIINFLIPSSVSKRAVRTHKFIMTLLQNKAKRWDTWSSSIESSGVLARKIRTFGQIIQMAMWSFGSFGSKSSPIVVARLLKSRSLVMDMFVNHLSIRERLRMLSSILMSVLTKLGWTISRECGSAARKRQSVPDHLQRSGRSRRNVLRQERIYLRLRWKKRTSAG